MWWICGKWLGLKLNTESPILLSSSRPKVGVVKSENDEQEDIVIIVLSEMSMDYISQALRLWEHNYNTNTLMVINKP